MLFYNSADSQDVNDTTSVQLQLLNLPSPLQALSSRMALFLLDNDHGNAHTTWVQLGQPKFPSPTDFAALRRSQEIPLISLQPVQQELRFNVTLPGLVLVHLCADDGQLPVQPTNLRVIATPTIAPLETMLRWDDANNRCIKTYALNFRQAGSSDFVRVNSPDTIFLGFLHAHNSSGGCYTVAAIDYWGRFSPTSTPACYDMVLK